MLELFYGFLITMLVFVPLETLFPKRKDKKIFRKLWKLDCLYALGIGVLISAGSFALILTGTVLLDFILPQALQDWIDGQSLILQVICVMLIADIGYYWIHRLHHEIPFLWRFHALHHSIEDMDWLAAHRVHPLDQILTRGGSLIIPFALGFSAPALAIWAGIFSWHSYLKHSNANIRLGPLRWIFATPTFHHWHHANEAHAFDKNYAGQLPALDILFGSALMEEENGPTHYGTDTHVADDFIGQLVTPFVGKLNHR